MKTRPVRVLVFAAAAAMLISSCGAKKAAEKEVKRTVEGFFDAAKSGDKTAIEEYIKTETAAEYAESALGLDWLIEGMLGDMKELAETDAVKDITAAAIGEAAKHITYTFESIDVTDSDNANVKVTIEAPDFAAADISFEKLFTMASEVFGVDVKNEEQLARLVMDRTGLSAEELKAMYANMSENGISDQLLTSFEPEIKELISRMIDDMANSSTTKSDVSLDLSRDGGAWKITDMK
ncbi:MAG: hypothetical protein IJH94_01990 [Clostridia bacterium]|nr:hypothetical protein [Clostridia bacterium]